MADAVGSATSLSLLERLREDPRNETAWAEFVRRYRPKILGWCRDRGAREPDAEDVAQIVLAKLADTMRTFQYDPVRSFRAWLRTVTQNALQDFRDAQRIGSAGACELLADPQARNDLEQRLQAAFDLERLEEAKDRVRSRVEPHTWEAFRLTALEGMTADEAAARLGILRALVYVAKHRVQKLMQQELQRLQAEAGENQSSLG